MLRLLRDRVNFMKVGGGSDGSGGWKMGIRKGTTEGGHLHCKISSKEI